MVRGEKDEHDRQVAANLGLVHKLAREYQRTHRLDAERTGYTFEDLTQEGIVGLIEAVKTYRVTEINPDTGQPYAFSTWASWKINGAIRRAVRDHNGLVRVPAYVYDAGHRTPTPRSLDQSSTALAEQRGFVHSRGAGNNISDNFYDFIPDPNVDVEAEALAQVAVGELEALLVRLVNDGVLSINEGYLVARIAGFLPAPDPRVLDRPHAMLSIVARERGVSRERARQWRNSAWAKLAPHLAAWDSPETVSVLVSAVRRTSRSVKTTKPADTTPTAANLRGVHATGVSSTSTGSVSESLSQPSVQQFKRTGTPRRVQNSTNVA